MNAVVPFAKRAVPACVVVDSRNVYGQARDVFGTGRHVTVQGVIDMFADFAFDVQDVWVAIATQGNQKGSAWLKHALQQNAAFAAAIASDPRGHVLEGRLVERGASTDEKLVDVLCAIQIARLSYEIAAKNRQGVILVMSEDMDLIPAYEFARELGVTVFACSNDTVDTRHRFSQWCLLPEASLEKAVGRTYGRNVASELRRFIAKTLMHPAPVSLRFKVSNYQSASGVVRLVHNSGARAIWRNAPKGTYTQGAAHSLFVRGCVFEDSTFPSFLVDPQPPAQWPPANCILGDVVAWRTACRVTVKFPGVTKALEAPPGTLLPGMKVLAQRDTSGRQEAWRFIGSTGARPTTPGWPDPASPVIVRAISTSGSPGALVRALILSSGQEVTLQPPSEVKAQTGMEFAAVPAGHADLGDGKTHVRTVAISSPIR